MLTLEKRKVWRWSIVERDALIQKQKVFFFGKVYELDFPLGLEENEIGDERVMKM